MANFKSIEEKELERTIFGEELVGKDEKFADEESSSESHSEELKVKEVWKDSEEDNDEVFKDEDYFPDNYREIPKWAKIKKRKPDKLIKPISSDLKLIEDPETPEPEDYHIKPFFFLKKEFKKKISSLQFCNSDNLLTATSANGNIKIFTIGDNVRLKQNILTPECKIRSARFLEHESELVFSGGRKPCFFSLNLPSGKLKKHLQSFGRNTNFNRRMDSFEKDKRAKISRNRKISAQKQLEKSSLNLENKERSFVLKVITPLFEIENPLKEVKSYKLAIILSSGEAKIFSSKTMKELNSLKINGRIEDGVFSDAGRIFIAVGDDCEIYKWDLKSSNCISRIKDPSVKLKAVSASKDGTIIAVGNSSGIINIYNKNRLVKSFKSIVTEISSLMFSNSSELLLAFSSLKRNCLRLIHVKSLTMLKQWPSSVFKFGVITSAAFSMDGRRLAVGNRKGSVILFDILKSTGGGDKNYKK